MMESLFTIKPTLPEGFLYSPGFLTIEEERTLCELISQIELDTFKFQGYEAKRRVANFGFDYSFDNGSLTAGKEIPAAFKPLIEKVARYIPIDASEFKELLITEYPAGAVINWHRDAPPFEVIAGISLAADCKFRLRPHDKLKQNRKNILSLNVERRSLYVMQGAARREWQHSTAPADKTRFSITLRTLSKPPVQRKSQPCGGNDTRMYFNTY